MGQEVYFVQNGFLYLSELVKVVELTLFSNDGKCILSVENPNPKIALGQIPNGHHLMVLNLDGRTNIIQEIQA